MPEAMNASTQRGGYSVIKSYAEHLPIRWISCLKKSSRDAPNSISPIPVPINEDYNCDSAKRWFRNPGDVLKKTPATK